MLRRGIQSKVGSRDQTHDGTHVDDPARPLTPHCRQHRVRYANDAEEVNVEQRLSLGDRGFLGPTEQSSAGIIDKQVNSPSVGYHLTDQLCDRSVIGYVADEHGYAV